ncbi:Protein of unknown function DUF538 [Dillenia turbinata]|uniref:Uncharacterized protein n=1 Tax=Dillenia turbinata TaxID=194707 RepID=A0AAN8ZK11_9MAGN
MEDSLSLSKFMNILFSLYMFIEVSCSGSVYEELNSHGLPMGLLPKGVRNFSIDGEGKFEVYLDQACNAKFENQLHYDEYVSGKLSFGQIGGLIGISAQELFLWFPVKGIRVDIPSSGIIYFDVGVVFKQFSLSLFENPPDCFAVRDSDDDHAKFNEDIIFKDNAFVPYNDVHFTESANQSDKLLLDKNNQTHWVLSKMKQGIINIIDAFPTGAGASGSSKFQAFEYGGLCGPLSGARSDLGIDKLVIMLAMAIDFSTRLTLESPELSIRRAFWHEQFAANFFATKRIDQFPRYWSSVMELCGDHLSKKRHCNQILAETNEIPLHIHANSRSPTLTLRAGTLLAFSLAFAHPKLYSRSA